MAFVAPIILYFVSYNLLGSDASSRGAWGILCVFFTYPAVLFFIGWGYLSQKPSEWEKSNKQHHPSSTNNNPFRPDHPTFWELCRRAGLNDDEIEAFSKSFKGYSDDWVDFVEMEAKQWKKRYPINRKRR